MQSVLSAYNRESACSFLLRAGRRSRRKAVAGEDTNVRAILIPAVPTKGELTRQAILGRALGLATRVGLEALTIGRLADDLGMSKSGLFATSVPRTRCRWRCCATRRRSSSTPSSVRRSSPHAARRVRACSIDGCCGRGRRPAAAAACSSARRPSSTTSPVPARDELVRQQREWLAFISRAVTIGIEEGHFRKDSDTVQFAHDSSTASCSATTTPRGCSKDRNAELRARRAFDRLLGSIAQPLRAARRPRSA